MDTYYKSIIFVIMNNQKPQNRKYDATFKDGVLRQVASGQPAIQVAKALGISESLIYIWRSAEKKKESSASDSSVLFQELELVKSKLRQVEMERDILKKAVSIFSRTA